MAPSYPDCCARGLWQALIAAGALLCLLPAHAAGDKCEVTEVKWTNDNTEVNLDAGTISYGNLEMRQGSLLLRAGKADATGVLNGNPRNSTWTLTGGVHLECAGAVLDAPMATVVFADGRLKTANAVIAPAQLPQQQKNLVHLEFEGALLDARTAAIAFADGSMKSAEAQGAVGAPAQFSHQRKNSARRIHGHAEKVEYDAGTRTMRVSGNTAATDGDSEFQSQELTYNLGTGVLKIPTKSSGTLRSESDQVPAPRTPDRASAK